MKNLWVAIAAGALVCGCTCGGPGQGTGGGAGGGDAGGAGGGSAGGGAGGGATSCLAGVISITVTPGAQVLTVGASPAPITFTATATTPTGPRDVTGQVTWTASRDDDTPPGKLNSAGVYQPQGAGGTVTIEATDGCVSGQTTVEFHLETTFKDPGVTVTSRFAGTVVTTNATKRPDIVYPSDLTRFPRNIYKILFQWKKGGNDYFRLTFDGPFSKTIVYSDGTHLQCQAATASACLEADLPIWQAIAGSNAGALTTLTIDAVTTGDTNVYRSASIQLGFSKRDVKGAIFYWSTTAAGIRRASVSDLDPEAYLVAKPTATVLPNGGGAVKCVACHTVSRSGKKIIAYTQANATGEFVYDVTLQPPPTPVITTMISTAKGFGTFRPDDVRVVATVGSLLKEFDANNGTKIADLPIVEGTNPDWSPTTSELAYSDQGGDSPGGANLKSIAYTNGAWGAIRTMVPAAGFTNLFPSFSPDGAYIAYARGKGGHGDKTLQLWLAKSDGSTPPVELVTANRIVNSAVTLGQHENNMPTWAPPGDLHWVAFNSVRPYGVVFPTGGTQQIWVSAIDPAKLGQKLADGGMVDPSYPAFRFAFQGLAENNHRAFWTIDVRDPPDAGGPTCSSLGSVCAADGGGLGCCAGLSCEAGGPLGSTCQSPNDAGVCISVGGACSQTSGASCCTGFVCDVGPDGGTACNIIIN